MFTRTKAIRYLLISADTFSKTVLTSHYWKLKARASGKTTIVASTEGNVTIPNREEKVGLNVYRNK